MIHRSVEMIFEPSGLPVPSEEEVMFEAHEIVQRCGWGMPLIERLHRLTDPYWREAVARCLMEKWQEMVRDKDEQTYYYDMDGYVCYRWADAEYDLNRVIRHSTAEQVDYEQTLPLPVTATPVALPKNAQPQIINNYYITTHNGPIITDSNVTIH